MQYGSDEHLAILKGLIRQDLDRYGSTPSTTSAEFRKVAGRIAHQIGRLWKAEIIGCGVSLTVEEAMAPGSHDPAVLADIVERTLTAMEQANPGDAGFHRAVGDADPVDVISAMIEHVEALGAGFQLNPKDHP